MHDISTEFRPRRPLDKPARRAYWRGFSVCLFIVLLSVFTWVLQRRMTQYESMHQAGGHHLTATKVCLTERPRISLPAIQTMDGASMFFVAIAFAGALLRLDNSPAMPISRDSDARPFRARTRFCMAHFFFLPPPATLPTAL